MCLGDWSQSCRVSSQLCDTRRSRAQTDQRHAAIVCWSCHSGEGDQARITSWADVMTLLIACWMCTLLTALSATLCTSDQQLTLARCITKPLTERQTNSYVCMCTRLYPTCLRVSEILRWINDTQQLSTGRVVLMKATRPLWHQERTLVRCKGCFTLAPVLAASNPFTLTRVNSKAGNCLCVIIAWLLFLRSSFIVFHVRNCRFVRLSILAHIGRCTALFQNCINCLYGKGYWTYNSNYS